MLSWVGPGPPGPGQPPESELPVMVIRVTWPPCLPGCREQPEPERSRAGPIVAGGAWQYAQSQVSVWPNRRARARRPGPRPETRGPESSPARPQCLCRGHHDHDGRDATVAAAMAALAARRRAPEGAVTGGQHGRAAGRLPGTQACLLIGGEEGEEGWERGRHW
jgi:hypothetical protein